MPRTKSLQLHLLTESSTVAKTTCILTNSADLTVAGATKSGLWTVSSNMEVLI